MYDIFVKNKLEKLSKCERRVLDERYQFAVYLKWIREDVVRNCLFERSIIFEIADRKRLLVQLRIIVCFNGSETDVPVVLRFQYVYQQPQEKVKSHSNSCGSNGSLEYISLISFPSADSKRRRTPEKVFSVHVNY